MVSHNSAEKDNLKVEGETPAEAKAEAGQPIVESLQKALDEAKAQAEANLAGWQRVQADFINYKRRSEQEKAEAIKYANTNVILSLLPVLDDFERALGTMPKESRKEKWIEGVKMIERKLRKMLETIGVSPIEALGKEFDPNCHEAVTCCQGKKDCIVQELEKGYRFNDRVIRPSKVMVGSGAEEKPEEKPKEE